MTYQRNKIDEVNHKGHEIKRKELTLLVGSNIFLGSKSSLVSTEGALWGTMKAGTSNLELVAVSPTSRNLGINKGTFTKGVTAGSRTAGDVGVGAGAASEGSTAALLTCTKSPHSCV
jgi:hypothetical protein